MIPSAPPVSGPLLLPSGWCDPEMAFDALCSGAEHAFWLDDASGRGWSYVGLGGPPIAAIPEALPMRLPSAVSSSSEGTSSGDLLSSVPPFQSGWVGWLSYEREACFMPVRRMLAFDHATRSIWAVADDDGDGDAAAWAREASALLASFEHASPRSFGSSGLDHARPPIDALQENSGDRLSDALDRSSPSLRLAGLRWRHDDAAYMAMIAACQDAIIRGDAYQLCLTNMAEVPGRFDPIACYHRLRRLTPSHHGALIRIDDRALLSASPEQFLRIEPDGLLRTRPIKGTRPRDRDPVVDDRLADELRSSEKERAENVMIVDLMRNDLGRVAVIGSVTVPELLIVERYATVHQLVSTVEARLRPGFDVRQVLEAVFPGGSMTGAPKLSAMSILADLEGGARGIYSGIYGWIGRDGSADLAMVIRSIVLGPDGAHVGAGGGITVLSEPAAEVAEFHLKAAPLLTVLAEEQAVWSHGGHERDGS